MDTRAKREYLVLTFCSLLLIGLIVPSLWYARREYRDGLQREALAGVKRKLEDVNNKLGYYPISFSAEPYEYYVTIEEGKKALGWYVRARLENWHQGGTAFDAEEGHNFFYRYVQQDTTTYYEICGGELAC